MRGARRAHAGERDGGQAGGPRLGLRRHQPRARGRRARPRPVPADAGRGAVGARDRRPVGHPVAPVDPARVRHGGAEGAIPAPGVPWRASRRVRDHRGGRRLGPEHGAHDRSSRRRRRRVGDRRREVARHVRRRRGLLRAARARRRRPRAGDGVPRRQGHAGRPARPDAEVHAHVRVRAPDLRVRGRAGRRGPDPRRDRPWLRAHEGLVRRGAAHDRRAYRRRVDAGAGSVPGVRVRARAVRTADRRRSRRSSSCSPTWRPS